MDAAVVTVTLGRPELEQTIKSIDEQTYPVTHYILCDAAMKKNDFDLWEMEYASDRRHFMYWPTKVGGKDLEGRRLLAAAPHLINEEVTLFCNDDDWFKPNHVESLMRLMKEGYQWAYTLRSIYDKDGTYLFDDKCEALGELHDTWNTTHHRFVDLNMWAMRTELLKQFSAVLSNKGWGMDRLLYQTFTQVCPHFTTTRQHTFCFRLGGNEYSVSKKFFEVGHEQMKLRYPKGLPWEV